jgi:trans-AT polyketide synthase/acyltransferase/oxidoreductase domain-containing protein
MENKFYEIRRGRIYNDEYCKKRLPIPEFQLRAAERGAMTTYVFPGQGSQNKGMGGTLFDQFSELTAQADAILGYSIKQLCLEDPQSKLSRTQYTQPALYIVNAFSYLKKLRETGEIPNFVAGHSLGEYSALFAAEVFDFPTGLQLVKKRGELMSRASDGAMAAILGLDEEQIVRALNKHDLHQVDIANYNSPSQIVISGLKTDIDRAKAVFEAMPEVKLFAPLKTSGAFHSRYMESAKAEFADFLNGFTLAPPGIHVISNVWARPYQPDMINQNLIDQLTHPVQWSESIRYLMGLGEIEFVEVGPGKVLNGLIQHIKKEAEPLVLTPAEIEAVFSPRAEEIPPVEAAEAVYSVMLSSATQSEAALSLEIEEEVPEKVSGSADGTAPSSQTELRSGPILATALGSPGFKKDYNLKYAYLTGGMYRGIASRELVVEMGRAGMMGFFGTGGLDLSQIEADIRFIQKELSRGEPYGMNFIHQMNNPDLEAKTVDLFLQYGVKRIEAAAFLNITPALVRYRAKGLTRDAAGKVVTANKIIAKISRPEVAEAFLSPAPDNVVARLLKEDKISVGEAELLKEVPVADDLCAEADSAGHTDGASPYALIPAIIQLRDQMMTKYGYAPKVRVGAAGGIGTPQAAAAAFIMGADFIMTGSINQCTVEAATSDAVKDLLQQMNVQDTDYAPAGDMFELGAKVQVLKKGLFFAARANKLYDLYRFHNSLEEIDEKTRQQLQDRYFKRSFTEIYDEVKAYYPEAEIEKAKKSPKTKMAMIFKWYFGYSTRLALKGNVDSQVDFQVHIGPALGAFNQWVKGTELENWRNRHVHEIALKLLNETAELLNQRYSNLQRRPENE